MSQEIARSVARLVAKYGSETPIQGTAFLVGNKYLITCKHCAPSPYWDIEATFQQVDELPGAKCHPIWYHPTEDIAILELIGELPSTKGLPLLDTVDLGPWETFGYPDYDNTGRTLSGRIEQTAHIVEGHLYISLNAGQDTGQVIGMSGSPILQHGNVIGILSDKTILNGVYAVPLSSLREAIRELANRTESWGTLCSLSDKLRREVSIRLTDGNRPSTLYYFLVSVQNKRMQDVKTRLEGIRLDDSYGSVEQLVLWSLLGSRELLMSIRANSKTDAETLRQKIIAECTPGIKLENAEWIDIQDEYAVVKDCLEHVGVKSTPVIGYDKYRSIKAFIQMKISYDLLSEVIERYLQKVLRRVSRHIAAVDLLAVSKDCHQIVIELSLPCGQFDNLNSVTHDMEDGFDMEDFVKNTFVAYSSDVLISQ